jgi:Transposase DDE domain group 1
MSCHNAIANQVRLVLHTAAYWLMLTVRAAIPETNRLATAEFATIRERLIKIGARVIEFYRSSGLWHNTWATARPGTGCNDCRDDRRSAPVWCSNKLRRGGDFRAQSSCVPEVSRVAAILGVAPVADYDSGPMGPLKGPIRARTLVRTKQELVIAKNTESGTQGPV